MTYSSAQPQLSIQLVPMQVVEALPLAASGDRWLDTPLDSGIPSVNLRLCPGEASELIVQLDNPGDRPLQISHTLTGNFPLEWCQVGGEEGREIAPHQQMNLVLYFRIEADFFERHGAVQPSNPLEINYQGQIQIHTTPEGSGQRQTQICPFNLYVRPDSLYLNFLPELYREVDFIGRFLKVFESGFEPAVHTLETLWANLDPLTAPQAMLPFLAYWVGWPSDVPWDVITQRRLIRRAMELYRWRGTKRGLRLYLHLYTRLSLDQPDTPELQRHICIQEVFNEGFVFNRARLGYETIVGGGRPYHFIVRLRSPQPETLNQDLIQSIINQEKPAFCSYDLYIESVNRRLSPSSARGV